VKRIEPDWALLALPEVEFLPAIRWKLANLGQMTEKRHKQALSKLEDVLSSF
jgi:hypothetical protein